VISTSGQEEAKLYVILGSHACRAGILMLDHKGIEYRTVTIPTGLHPIATRLLGFPGNPVPRRIDGRRPRSLALADKMGTVPALRYDGERVQTNRLIARFLDRVRPEPPLFPADPARRAAVEEAERWGDEVFQMVARRLASASILHGRDAMLNRANDGRLGPLLWRSESVRFNGVRLVARFFRVTRESERELLDSLLGMLVRIDGWIETGILNGEELNAADFMIAPSVALLTYRRDLVDEIESRPVRALIDRLLPDPAGSRAP
jgi:glutathione S-transferase